MVCAEHVERGLGNGQPASYLEYMEPSEPPVSNSSMHEKYSLMLCTRRSSVGLQWEPDEEQQAPDHTRTRKKPRDNAEKIV